MVWSRRRRGGPLTLVLFAYVSAGGAAADVIPAMIFGRDVGGRNDIAYFVAVRARLAVAPIAPTHAIVPCAVRPVLEGPGRLCSFRVMFNYSTA